MCGIVGFTGKEQAAPILLDGLGRLEYRGYDSAGLCTCFEGKLDVQKAQGRLKVLAEKVQGGKTMPGNTGIGHTRWATHGVPNDVNAHPHMSYNGKIVLVHNGIIENYISLKDELIQDGILFKSDTDTEVAVNVIAKLYSINGDFFQAVLESLRMLEGSYAFAIMCADEPGKIIAVKKGSPLILGIGDGCNFIASDVPAILKYTRQVCYLRDGEVVVITADSYGVFERSGAPIEKEIEHVEWELSAAEKGGYDHFMLKEIYEQPSAVAKTIAPRVKTGRINFDGSFLTPEYLESIDRIYVVACGSAYYVGCVGKYVLEKQCRIPVEPMLASEFRYCDPVADERSLVLVISQSGETADSLEALREAKRLGAKTLAIVNVVGSSISKEADCVIYTWAGPEIAVATTKAYSTQLAIVYLLSLFIADVRGKISADEYTGLLKKVQELPQKLEAVLTDEMVKTVKGYAQEFCKADDVFFIGRNVDSATCLEGSLKLKEIAYIHSESYAAGELKHGPISLIQDGTLVVAVASGARLFDKVVSNIKEVKARGALVMGLTTERFSAELAKSADRIIAVPETEALYQPSVSVVPLQIFAYYVALYLDRDIDKPRNLAKSVTVE